MDENNKEKIEVFILKSLKLKLRNLAKVEGVTMGEIVKKALNEYINKQ